LLLGLDPISQDKSDRILIAYSRQCGTLIGMPVGNDVRTQTLPMPHRACVQPLPLDFQYIRGTFEIGADQVLVLPNLDRLAAPVWGRMQEGRVDFDGPCST